MAQAGHMVQRAFGGPAGWISVLIPAALFAFFVSLAPQVADTGPVLWSVDWIPSFDIRFSALIDGLSLTFALLITGIGTLVALFSIRYLGSHPEYERFVLFLLLFMFGMLGLVLADNIITLFVFWEVTTITSYLLIGFDSDSAKSRRNALQALLVTGAGALAMLAGLILLGNAAGSWELSVILTQGEAIREHPHYTAILILVLIGAFTKSAQFPFHFWLPNAMAAPTPVSAYLHSATMVKGGVYLLARVNPALGGTEPWFWALIIAGGFTAVFASVLAVRQTDIKQVLAYTTLMALGTLVLFIGAGTSEAIKAAMIFLVVHSLYKAALFLMIGTVDHEAGTREVSQLGGLSRKMPVTALAAWISALSMAGIPPLFGFIGKEFLYKAGLDMEVARIWITGSVFAASALMVAAAGIVALRPFVGPLKAPQAVHEGPWPMWIGPLILAGCSAGFGLFSDIPERFLVGPAVTAVYGAEAEVDLYLYAGVNDALILSVITLALGACLYGASGRLRSWLAGLDARAPVHFDPGWDRAIDGLKGLAKWQTRYLQSGRLQTYMMTIFLVLAVGVGLTIVLTGAFDIAIDWSATFDELLFRHWAILAFVTAGSIMAARTRSRMTAIAALGVVGVGVALIFIMFSAPDVAITQLLVETLVVVLVAVAMLKLPHLDPGGVPDRRPWHAVLSVVVGAGASVILLMMLNQPLDLTIPEYFEAAAWPEAHGRNIVNVILVDFRALDTFGEIAVVVIAALAAYALFKGVPGGRYEPPTPPQEDQA